MDTTLKFTPIPSKLHLVAMEENQSLNQKLRAHAESFGVEDYNAILAADSATAVARAGDKSPRYLQEFENFLLSPFKVSGEDEEVSMKSPMELFSEREGEIFQKMKANAEAVIAFYANFQETVTKVISKAQQLQPNPEKLIEVSSKISSLSYNELVESLRDKAKLNDLLGLSQ